jgi:hypothetical protein
LVCRALPIPSKIICKTKNFYYSAFFKKKIKKKKTATICFQQKGASKRERERERERERMYI